MQAAMVVLGDVAALAQRFAPRRRRDGTVTMPPVERTVSAGARSLRCKVSSDIRAPKAHQRTVTLSGSQPSQRRQAARPPGFGAFGRVVRAVHALASAIPPDRPQPFLRSVALGPPFDHHLDHSSRLPRRLWAASASMSIGRASIRWTKDPITLSRRRPPRPSGAPTASRTLNKGSAPPSRMTLA